MVTVTSIGSTVIQPSVTLKVTSVKFGFVFANCAAARPIYFVPASCWVAAMTPSTRVAPAAGVNEKLFATLYKVLSAVAV